MTRALRAGYKPFTLRGVVPGNHSAQKSIGPTIENAFICAKAHANAVPKVAGTPILKILRNPLLAITRLASSDCPAFARRNGLIAHTYPLNRKKILVQNGPEAIMRKKGR